MKINKKPLIQRMMSRLGAVRSYRGLLLLLALLLLAAGCGPTSIAGSWAGINADENGLVLVNTSKVTRINDVGTARWEYPRPGQENQGLQLYARPALTEDVVYVGGFDHKVYALDRENGLEIWVNEDADDRIIGGPVIAQGKIVVGIGGGGVMALNQRNGQQEWFFNTDQGIWAAPLVVNGWVFVTSMDHHIYALDLDSGEEIWRRDLEGAIAGTPVFRGDEETGEGVLYIGSFAHKMFMLAASSGEIIRSTDASNWVWGGPSLSDDGILYFGDMSGYVYAVEADSLDPVWQRQVAEGAVRSTPLIVDDMLIVGSRDGRVYALDRFGGSPVWTQIAGADVLSDLVLLEDNVVVVSTMGEKQLIAYDLEEAGQELWSYPPVVSQE